MRKMTGFVLALFIFTTFGGCGSSERAANSKREYDEWALIAYQEAQATDTIVAYKRFLRTYSTSDHVEAAAVRIAEIEKATEERRLEWKRTYPIRLEKLQAYSPDTTTLEEFVSDGWNAEDAYDGMIGVLGYNGNAGSFSVVLGVIEDANFSRMEALGLGDSVKQLVARGAGLASDIETWKAGEGIGMETSGVEYREVCSLRFDRRFLKSIECSELE